MFEALLPALIVGTLAQLAFTVAIALWGRWVARRMGNTTAWRWAARGPWISFVLLTLGTVLGARFLISAFDRVATLDPAHKTAALADGISNAMNVSAMCFVPGYLALLVSVVMFSVGTLRRV